MARLSNQIHRLFLRFLNFAPALIAKAQEEAELQQTDLDVLLRDALEKHLRELEAARKEEEAENSEYARLVLRAHFAEDRNEFLAEDAIRRIGG